MKYLDSVPHEHLLLKLQCLGITGQLLQWVRSFLISRFQRVVINGSYSDWLPVRSGVPQGSVLGPLLFLLYIDDLHNVVSNSTLKLFADDVALYREVKCSADCSLLQQDLDNISSWTTKWQLRLNASKCGVFPISNKRKPLTYKYEINGAIISWISIVKYLGVYIQSNLSWSHHCRTVSVKARQSLNYLRHSIWGATTAVKSVAYKSLVRPLLEYACQVWNPHTARDKSVLEAVQRRAAKWACGSRWDPSSRKWNKSSGECLDTLHWPTLTQRRNYLSVSTLGDIFHKRTSLKFSDYYCFNASCTRAHELCVVPLQSTINCYRYSFFVNAAFFWNSVPAHILNMNSIAPFRQSLYYYFCT